MRSILIPMMLLLVGCASNQRNTPDSSVPYPIKMALFPALEEIPNEDITLTVLFNLDSKGHVVDVAMVGPGLNPAWNAAALDSMRKWQFSTPPSIYGNADIWIRRGVKVQFEEPVFMDLVSLTIPDKTIADSVYATLRYRSRLIDLFEDHSKHDFAYSYIVERDFNIGRYPDHVRNELRKLRINSYTKPIQLDQYYVIFQRLDTLSNHIQ